jgi:hypothetical protein
MSTDPLIGKDFCEDARRSTLDARRLARVFLPISLGLLLLSAAFLKGYELFTSPLPETSLWTSRGVRIAGIEAEWGLGLWLLSGRWSRWARWTALVAFHGFFAFNLSKALAGEANCGCFGPVPINPGWTAGLDLAAIVALWLWRPGGYPGQPIGMAPPS